MAQRFSLSETEKHFKQVLLYAPGMLGNMAVNFFLDRFRYQNWLGNTTEPWAQRKRTSKWQSKYTKKRNNAGRALLVQSGRLRRSIRITSVHAGRVSIGSDVPYARAHNEGVRLGIIQNVKRYQVKKYKGNDLARPYWVNPHFRRIDQNIPRRQFMGNSPVLEKQLQRKLQAELLKGLR